MKRIKSYLFTCLFWSLLLCRAYGQDVILNPGYIQGDVSIDGVTITQLFVSASGCSGHYSNTSSTSGSYFLTVHVVDASCDYNVSCTVNSDDNKDSLTFRSAQTTVADGGTSTVNFSLTPGFVSGTVSISGVAVQYGRISAEVYTDGKYTNASTSFSQDGTFAFPVQPNTQIKLSGYVVGQDGIHYDLDEAEIDVAALQTVTHDWTVVPGDGAISGNCSLDGVATDWISLYFSNSDNSSTSTSADAGGNYEVTGILPGSWTTTVSMRMNSYDDSLSLPRNIYTNPVTVPAGGTVENYITAVPAFVNGRVRVSGSKGIEDVSSGTVRGSGISGSDSYGGSGYDRLNASNGDYDLILTRGNWNVCSLSLNFYGTGDDYLSSSMSYTDYSKNFYYGTGISLEDNGVVNDWDFDIGTGTATINFSVEGGGIFSDPRVSGSCSVWNDASQPSTYTSINASHYATDITEGSVTFVGTPGTYAITAQGVVNNSLTTFGELGVVVVKGTDVIIDIGAPSLTLTAPEPDACATGSVLTVSGTATDENGVASVTINGTAVAFASTNNPEDENEISFSYDVGLSAGANLIETSVSDTGGRTITDKRTVYFDSNLPVLTFTPPDGDSTSESAVTVSGTATDDGAVARISVNGDDLTFTSTGNESDPAEVAFTTSLALTAGVNEISVVVEDSCGNTTTEVHEITMSPLCEAVDDLTAVPKDRKIQLVWTARGGEAYNIYRRISGEEYAFLAESGSEYSTYLDLNLTNGITYYYYIKTVCGGEEQDASNEVSATPARRTR